MTLHIVPDESGYAGYTMIKGQILFRRSQPIPASEAEEPKSEPATEISTVGEASA